MEVNLKIDQECIDAGVPNECQKCPMALALAKLNFVEESCVYHESSLIKVNGKIFVADNPQEVESFVRNFDAREEVLPFEAGLSFTEMGTD